MEIQVELEDVSQVKKKLKVTVPAQVASSEWERLANEYKRHARLPGFRPGKVPLDLIKRRFHKDLRSEVIQKLVSDSFPQALKEKNVEAIGSPDLEKVEFEAGQPLSYEAVVEILPEVTPPEYKGLEVSVESKSVSDEDVETELKKLQEQHASLVSVEDRPIQEGDYALIDLKGEYLEAEGHGHAHKPIENEDVTVKVGDENTLAEFNEVLPGMSIAEEKEFEVEYPADYPEKKLAGHRVRFHVEVSDIKRRELPELNDEFAKDLGQYDTLDQLRTRIRESLEAQVEETREAEIRRKLVDQLIEATDFQIPDVMMQDRIDDKIRDLAYRLAAQGVDPSKANVDWLKLRDRLKPEAERDVRGAMILDAIIQKEEIQITDEELEAELQSMADSSKQPVEKVRQYYEREGRMAVLHGQIGRRKAMDLIRSNAKVA